jgi:hypothetical protein
MSESADTSMVIIPLIFSKYYETQTFLRSNNILMMTFSHFREHPVNADGDSWRQQSDFSMIGVDEINVVILSST